MRSRIVFVTFICLAAAACGPRSSKRPTAAPLDQPTADEARRAATPGTPPLVPAPGSALTYVSVKGIIFEACLGCHNSRIPPLLGQFPFGKSPAELATIMAEFKATINSATSPMPPQGLLPADQLAALNGWIDNGYPAGP